MLSFHRSEDAIIKYPEVSLSIFKFMQIDIVSSNIPCLCSHIVAVFGVFRVLDSPRALVAGVRVLV